MDVGNPYYTELARGIEDRLAQDDHTLILCSSDDDPRREARFLRLFAEPVSYTHLDVYKRQVAY